MRGKKEETKKRKETKTGGERIESKRWDRKRWEPMEALNCEILERAAGKKSNPNWLSQMNLAD